MLLQLHCGGYSIGLQLPASPADVQQKLNTLRNGSEQNAPISIRDVNEPLSYLRQYIQNVDLTSGPELEKLNRLSEKVDGMSAQEQHILWGALPSATTTKQCWPSGMARCPPSRSCAPRRCGIIRMGY